jgi:hypothetical protein
MREASKLMEQSSQMFRTLRYEEDLIKAGELLSRIADTELKVLNEMERGWDVVRQLPKQRKSERSSLVA